MNFFLKVYNFILSLFLNNKAEVLEWNDQKEDERVEYIPPFFFFFTYSFKQKSPKRRKGASEIME